MNVQYEQQGDYLIPCIRTKEQKEIYLCVWADHHRRYLKEHHKVRYYNLLASEKLCDYLADIEEQAENMFLRLVKELAEKKKAEEKAAKLKNETEKSYHEKYRKRVAEERKAKRMAENDGYLYPQKICKKYDKAFCPKSPLAVYCSEACRRQNYLNGKKEWYERYKKKNHLVEYAAHEQSLSISSGFSASRGQEVKRLISLGYGGRSSILTKTPNLC